MVTNSEGVNRLAGAFCRIIVGAARAMRRFCQFAGALLACVLIAGTLFIGTVQATTEVTTEVTNDVMLPAPLRLMVLGDSLVAGHGLPQGQSFPDVLQAELAKVGHVVEIFNAGVSGDTTAGGLARLEWSFAENPEALIIVLGGNDLLRGLDPAATSANLSAIIDRARARGVAVLLAGMQAPRNLGDDYASEFDMIYQNLGARPDILYYPFFLEGVALVPEFNQADGMHPNLAGVKEITSRILPTARKLLGKVRQDQ